MSWKEKTVEQSREEFVLAALCGEDSISELCRKAGISRPTAYKWMRRYQAGEPLSDRSPYHAWPSQPDAAGDRGVDPGGADAAPYLGRPEADTVSARQRLSKLAGG